MKKYIVLAAATLLAIGTQAQSLEEGIKAYKYKCYSNAEKILTPLATNPIANYYLGLSQLEEGNNAAAKTTFTKFPEDAANMAGLARVAFEENNAALGTQLAQNVAGKAKKKEWEPLKYAADAITYSDGGNYQQAVDWYKKALSITDNADLHISLGDAYLHILGGGGEAMNNYENVTGKDPKNSLAFSRIGALWYAAKNYPLALESYEKAKQADPNNPLPYGDLANAYERSGNYPKALENIEQYIKLSCKSADDEIRYMDILFLSKHYKEAIAKANELIGQGIVKPRFYGILAFSEYETQDSANALKHGRMYITQQDPKKIVPADFIYVGKIMLQNRLNDEADQNFKKAIDIDTSKNKSDTYRMIAEAFKASRDYAKAASWYNKLVTEYPETQPLDYFWSTVMYYYAKDYSTAAAMGEKYETKYADQPSATYWRGRVAAAVDSEAKEGTAVQFFTKWLDKIGPNADKKTDMKIAYEYLLLYYYNKEDKENSKKYIDLINAIDPNDGLKKQIEELMKQPKGGTKAPAGKTPAKAPAKGKGK